jgi:hypothetical protein
MGGPRPPEQYGGENLDTDEKLIAADYAAGLDVWTHVRKAYIDHLGGDNILANAQLWSLREAIRDELQAEMQSENRSGEGAAGTD